MDDLILAVAEWAITGVLAVLATILWRALKRMQREFEAMRRGQQMQLRVMLVEMHREWVVEKGWMPVEQKRLFHDMFCAYEALGENGVIASLYDDVKLAHVAPDDE